MSNAFEKLAEKIGVVVQSGGILNIENFNFRGSAHQPRAHNEHLLLKQVQAEVSGLIDQSLINSVSASSEKEERNNLVKPLWSFDVKIPEYETDIEFSGSPNIIEIFDQESVAGKLLIVGDAGVGKTTAMLELARQLVLRANSNPLDPLPVLLNLASWDNHRISLFQWLTDKIRKKYGIPQKEVAELIKNRRLILFLDGQDEINPFFQKYFVLALNQFLSSDHRPLHLVVSSRFEEYKKLDLKLFLNGAIYIKPLTGSQIREYLREINKLDIWQLLENSKSLLDLAKVPLFLNLIILSKSKYVNQLSSTHTITYTEANDLLELYISKMLSTIGKSQGLTALNISKPRKVDRKYIFWLFWIAREMSKRNKSEWMIEELTPDFLLSKREKRLYLLGMSLSLGMPVGVAYTFLLESVLISLISASSDDYFFKPLLANFLLGNVVLFSFALCLLSSFFLMFLFENVGEMFEGSDRSVLAFIFRILIGISLALVAGSLVATLLILLTRDRTSIDLTLLLFLTGGILFGVIGDINSGIDIYDLKLASPQKTIQGILSGFSVGLFVGLLSGSVKIGLISSAIAVILFGLVGFIIGAINHQDPYLLSSPNQGIWTMFKKSISIGLFSAVTTGITIRYFSNTFYGLGCSIFAFLLYFLISGGKACLQHFWTRLILCYEGYIPWNYSQFLNQSTSSLILQRVGGRYRFIHKLLQEHIAAKPLERS